MKRTFTKYPSTIINCSYNIDDDIEEFFSFVMEHVDSFAEACRMIEDCIELGDAPDHIIAHRGDAIDEFVEWLGDSDPWGDLE